MAQFVGRKQEIKKLEDIAASGEASICVVYGRRRVGKTTLIEKVFSSRGMLKFEASENQDISIEL